MLEDVNTNGELGDVCSLVDQKRNEQIFFAVSPKENQNGKKSRVQFNSTSGGVKKGRNEK